MEPVSVSLFGKKESTDVTIKDTEMGRLSWLYEQALNAVTVILVRGRQTEI